MWCNELMPSKEQQVAPSSLEEVDELHLWLGHFKDLGALEELFCEQYEDFDKALNSFAETQGQRSYDHDFVEYSIGKGDSLEDLIGLNSYSEYYLEPALKIAMQMRIENANLFILADSGEFRSPSDVQTKDTFLKYLGRFPYRK